MTLDGAYTHCQSIARSHYENFPVASFLLPRKMRRHVAAVYAIARMGDDIADEHPDVSLRKKLEALDNLDSIVDGADPHGDPVFIAVQHTIQSYRIDPSLLHRLFEAFRRDAAGGQNVVFDTWDDVREYCHYSANPIGEIILRLAHSATPEAISYGNDICTALQITNFLQDRNTDLLRGRNYVPLTIGETIQRTRQLFRRGRKVIRCVHSYRLKLELRAVVSGGEVVLDKIEQSTWPPAGNERITLTPKDFLSIMLKFMRPL